MEKVKVGFLPLYLKLYDERAARLRPGIEAYRDALCGALEKSGLEVVCADICRTAPEFAAAVALSVCGRWPVLFWARREQIEEAAQEDRTPEDE